MYKWGGENILWAHKNNAAKGYIAAIINGNQVYLWATGEVHSTDALIAVPDGLTGEELRAYVVAQHQLMDKI